MDHNEPARWRCPRCGSTTRRRVNRIGGWERTFLTFFGWFPWECVQCRRKFFRRDDGRRSTGLGEE